VRAPARGGNAMSALRADQKEMTRMLTHPTRDRLIALGLTGMAKGLDEQRDQRNVEGLTFEERLGLLVDREAAERESKRLAARLKSANLRQNAAIEDLDTRAARGLDRALFARLATGEWIARRQDLLITGKTGTGKSWLACALGHKACRDDRSVLYWRVPRLLDALALARGDGRHARLLKALARVQLLILDDWGLATMTSQQGRDILEIVDDRHGRASTIVTSQLPIDAWHDVIPDPTVADAVLDRLVHTAHRLALKGESLRKPAAEGKQEKAARRGRLDTNGAE
jgi:DNA replication protein DnaC